MKLLCLVLSFVSSLCFSAPQLAMDQKEFYHACGARCSTKASDILQNNPQIDVSAVHDATGWTPLNHACYEGSTAVVRFLLGKGADVNAPDISDGWTPLRTACNQHCLDIAQLLLEGGADANKADIDGRTPLGAAVLRGDLVTISLLIRYGAIMDPAELLQAVRNRNRPIPMQIQEYVGRASQSLKSLDFEFLA